MQINRLNALALATAAAGIGWLTSSTGAQCPGGESPADFCGSSRVLSGAAGTQVVVVNPSTATAFSETVCTVPVGHTVWFSIVPSVSGLLTFSTCHPSTTYDTVAEAFSGGDSGCEFMSPVQCNDDTPAGECNNGCSAYGSRLIFNVAAGTQYRFRVGSYNNNSAACNLCLGVVVSLCDGETTPPEATIGSPAPLACVCPGSVAITGTVSDSGSGVASYALDYSPVAATSWTQIARGLGNVTGSLATWDTAALGEGDYYLRLTARDGCGNVGTSLRTVHVDRVIDSVQLRRPGPGSILGGYVYADGTAWDHCAPGQFQVFWLPTGGSTPILFDAINPAWVINDPLGRWNSRVVPDGNYTVRLTATNACGASATNEAGVTIDNMAPTAVISTPMSCHTLAPGVLQVRGTANDAHLASWVLQYVGGDVHSWVTISSGTTPVINSLLSNWDVRALRPCAYALRLVVTDAAVIDDNGAIHNQTEYIVAVDVGCPGDFNRTGSVSVQDIFDFLAAYFMACP